MLQLVDESLLQFSKEQRSLLINEEELATLFADAPTLKKYIRMHAEMLGIQVKNGLHIGKSEMILQVVAELNKLANSMENELGEVRRQWIAEIEKREQEKKKRDEQAAQ